MQKSIPRFSIIIPTLNNEHDIDAFFTSFEKQTFNKNGIEIIAADGGSTDKTVLLFKNRGVRVINNPYKLAEPGIHLGMEAGRADILMILALDNFLDGKDALAKISNIYENQDVYAAVLKHNSKPTYSLFTKYHNTFTDPFNHFINGYASNTRTFHKIYKTIFKSDEYDIYDFKSRDEVPMMSFSQGFTIRGTYKRKKKDMFDDITPVIDIIKSGKKIAYIHSISVFHDTNRDYKQFIRKQRWATENALSAKNYGIAYRAADLSLLQRMRMYVWPIYSLSIVLPTLRGLYGFLIDREKMWLFHPIECFLCGYANAVQVIEHLRAKMGNIQTISRK